MVTTFAKKNKGFHELVGWLPFTDRERQIHSVLLPSIAEISDLVYTEKLVSRARRRGSKFGFLDYWVYYRDIVLMMEVKKVFQGYGSSKLRSSTKERWKEVVDQVNSVGYDEISDMNVSADKNFRVAMMNLTLYQGSSWKDSLGFVGEEVLQDFDLVLDSLDPRPNWAMAWSLSRDLQEPIRYGERGDYYYETYPASLFLGLVRKRA